VVKSAIAFPSDNVDPQLFAYPHSHLSLVTYGQSRDASTAQDALEPEDHTMWER